MKLDGEFYDWSNCVAKLLGVAGATVIGRNLSGVLANTVHSA